MASEDVVHVVNVQRCVCSAPLLLNLCRSRDLLQMSFHCVKRWGGGLKEWDMDRGLPSQLGEHAKPSL